jgi:hypothetical protein
LDPHEGGNFALRASLFEWRGIAMGTASSLESGRGGGGPGHGSGGRRLIRQASAWLPSRAPTPAPLQDLERLNGVRWVDLNGAGLGISEAIALLDPVCHGQLRAGLVEPLIGPGRSGADNGRATNGVFLNSAFRIRHVRGADGGRASLFEPVRLLSGVDWLISCWLEPRVYRGMAAAADHGPEGAEDDLYLAVASGWLRDRSSSAADLAGLVRGELSRFGAVSAASC